MLISYTIQPLLIGTILTVLFAGKIEKIAKEYNFNVKYLYFLSTLEFTIILMILFSITSIF
jgi:hypothetical protein